MGWDALALARGQLVAAAAEAGIECIDGPWLDADDLDGLAAELRRLAAMGFSGKCSYDAAQIPAIHAAFTPSADEIEHAQHVIAAIEASATGSARADGRAVNKANAKIAQRVLALAARRASA
jgi:citrate lyase beta subunit